MVVVDHLDVRLVGARAVGGRVCRTREDGRVLTAAEGAGGPTAAALRARGVRAAGATAAELLALHDVDRGDRPVEGGHELGAGKVLLGDRERVPGRGEGGAVGGELVVRGVGVLVVGERRLGLSDRGLRVGHGELELGRVHGGQDVAGPNLVAGLDVDRGHRSRRAEREVVGLRRLEGALGGHGLGHGPERRLRRDLGRRTGVVRRGAVRAEHEPRDDADEADDGHDDPGPSQEGADVDAHVRPLRSRWSWAPRGPRRDPRSRGPGRPRSGWRWR